MRLWSLASNNNTPTRNNVVFVFSKRRNNHRRRRHDAEQRRESVVSTFLAQKRADLQKLRDYSTDFRGLETSTRRDCFRSPRRTKQLGSLGADLGLFFDTLVSIGVLCVVLSCLTLHERLRLTWKNRNSPASTMWKFSDEFVDVVVVFIVVVRVLEKLLLERGEFRAAHDARVQVRRRESEELLQLPDDV